MSGPLRVFDLHGVYVFRLPDDLEVPPELSRSYNEAASRFEVQTRAALDALPVAHEVVEDADEFRVRFRDDSPADVLDGALFVERGPMATTALYADDDALAAALEAGGVRVGRRDE